MHRFISWVLHNIGVILDMSEVHECINISSGKTIQTKISPVTAKMMPNQIAHFCIDFVLSRVFC